MMKRLLLTGAYQYTKKQKQELEHCGWDITFIQNELEEAKVPVETFEAVVCNNLFLYNDIKKFESLKMIQLTSAGTEQVPMDYLMKHKIKMFNAKGVYSIPMAEWAIMNILQLYKNAPGFYEKQKKAVWEKDRSLIELYGKNVVIIGYGDVGKEIAKRLKGFGVTITALNRSAVEDSNIDQWVPLDKMEFVLQKADIIILSIALTKETYHLIGLRQFCLMKKNSIFVNLSRGDVVCEDDLIKVLNDSWFRGVALDVFSKEPLAKQSPLWQYDRVIITPHNSFVSDNIHDRLFKVILKNLK